MGKNLRRTFAGASAGQVLEELEKVLDTDLYLRTRQLILQPEKVYVVFAREATDTPEVVDLKSVPLKELVFIAVQTPKETPPDGMIERLAQIVRDAQNKRPSSPRDFFKYVNAIADHYSLKFKLSDGRLAKIGIVDSSVHGTLTFRVKKTSTSFKKNDFEIVCVGKEGKFIREITPEPT
ncbi:MAG: hypothetical protein GC137_00745 [Alphaproteobacteria bacterium]|nr:hypothetical protein [Alphaproteobacteria bacterium]